MHKLFRWLGWPLILFAVLSCTGQSTELLSTSPTSSDDSSSNDSGQIVISSWDGNHRSVTYYSTAGVYQFHIDFRTEVLVPRGLDLLDSNTILVSGEGNDAIYTLDLLGAKTLFFGASTFNGSIYDVAYDSTAEIIYAIESNNIEAFDTNGVRQTGYRIPTTTGACTLSNPVSMIVNSADNLVVANVGGADEILTYDLSTVPASCLSAVAFGNNPYAIFEHSNGNLYVATQVDDQIYQADPDGDNATVVWATDLSVINNPQAIAELPNGNLIISSAATDTIEEITTAGARVGTAPFIIDALSLNIGDILVINGSSQ